MPLMLTFTRLQVAHTHTHTLVYWMNNHNKYNTLQSKHRTRNAVGTVFFPIFTFFVCLNRSFGTRVIIANRTLQSESEQTFCEFIISIPVWFCVCAIFPHHIVLPSPPPLSFSLSLILHSNRFFFFLFASRALVLAYTIRVDIVVQISINIILLLVYYDYRHPFGQC